MLLFIRFIVDLRWGPVNFKKFKFRKVLKFKTKLHALQITWMFTQEEQFGGSNSPPRSICLPKISCKIWLNEGFRWRSQGPTGVKILLRYYMFECSRNYKILVGKFKVSKMCVEIWKVLKEWEIPVNWKISGGEKLKFFERIRKCCTSKNVCSCPKFNQVKIPCLKFWIK
jgi:hypothetical protein